MKLRWLDVDIEGPAITARWTLHDAVAEVFQPTETVNGRFSQVTAETTCRMKPLPSLILSTSWPNDGGPGRGTQRTPRQHSSIPSFANQIIRVLAQPGAAEIKQRT